MTTKEELEKEIEKKESRFKDYVKGVLFLSENDFHRSHILMNEIVILRAELKGLKEGIAQERQRILKIIIDAVNQLKTNYPTFENISQQNVLGLYARFDELALIYADIKYISFVKAVEELNLEIWLKELKEKIKT